MTVCATYVHPTALSSAVISATVSTIPSLSLPPQTVSRLFDSCSPLFSGCKKNRENWLQLADEQEKENDENNSIIALATHEDTKGETQTEECTED